MTWRRILTSVAIAFAIAACGNIDCSPVPTPFGYVPKACIHAVPDGAAVETTDGGTTVVILDGAVVATYPPCACTQRDGGSAPKIPKGVGSNAACRCFNPEGSGPRFSEGLLLSGLGCASRRGAASRGWRVVAGGPACGRVPQAAYGASPEHACTRCKGEPNLRPDRKSVQDDRGDGRGARRDRH